MMTKCDTQRDTVRSSGQQHLRCQACRLRLGRQVSLDESGLSCTWVLEQ